ncbi:MAG: nitrile hydratase accessory protein [Deltaproteobacteria bacterium]|nr:nitrile hydratase accessory protein [Deltaproteobacteria bacterium]
MSQEQFARVDRRIADVLPRRSGELIFDAPWEKRGFGMAVSLCEQGLVPFDDFRWRVAAAISTWERANYGREEQFHFGERWVAALERLLIDRGIVSKEEIDQRMTELTKQLR